jgi:hypothetical protein
VNRARVTHSLAVVLASAWLAGAWVSCSAAGNGDSGSHNSVGAGGSASTGSAQTGGGGKTAGGGGSSANGGNGGGGILFPDAGCTPSTCQELNATCGPVTDPKCGGLVDCGTCPAGQSCGNAGPNQCGAGSADACAPLTCASQNANCGQIGDGCGNTLSCGTCNAPQTCGGGTAMNTCGCTGVCAQIPTCTGTATTTLSGTVLDPAGIHPLYNALVYIPNDPTDPGLQPFAPGITCDVCGSTAAGNPLVTAYTAPDGTFTLQNVPVGSAIPLVVQLGRWRRQFTENVSASCGANTIPAGTLTMPKNHTEGDIPRIGILTGGFDPMECVLRKMGIQDTEFTDPGGAGHISFYLAADPNVPPNPFEGYTNVCPANNVYGPGAHLDATTPSQATLFGTSGGQPTINQYDLVVLACEGYEEDEQANWPNLGAYTAAGGRVFMTDYAYDWMAQTKTCTTKAQCGTNGKCTDGYCSTANNVTENPSYPSVATWHTGQNPQGSPETGTIDLVSNPKGMAFEQWLQIVGVSTPGSGTVALDPVFHNSDSITAPTQQWLYWGAMTPIHFTFNTPVGGTSASQCGRVVYSDWHADNLGFAGSYPDCPTTEPLPTAPPYYSNGMTFPAECDSNPMTPQEAILEFMLFDLTACVQPYMPLCTPTTCAAQNLQCGPAGDGCGNLIQCGTCPNGEYCGGGGPGVCGTTSSCTPSTCAAQSIQCGQAGDGCGNVLNCGNCPTGEVCGLGGPGKCGMVH